MEEKERLWLLSKDIESKMYLSTQFDYLYNLIQREFEVANSIDPAKYQNYAWTLQHTIKYYAEKVYLMNSKDKNYKKYYTEFAKQFKLDVLHGWSLQA